MTHPHLSRKRGDAHHGSPRPDVGIDDAQQLDGAALLTEMDNLGHGDQIVDRVGRVNAGAGVTPDLYEVAEVQPCSPTHVDKHDAADLLQLPRLARGDHATAGPRHRHRNGAIGIGHRLERQHNLPGTHEVVYGDHRRQCLARGTLANAGEAGGNDDIAPPLRTGGDPGEQHGVAALIGDSRGRLQADHGPGHRHFAGLGGTEHRRIHWAEHQAAGQGPHFGEEPAWPVSPGRTGWNGWSRYAAKAMSFASVVRWIVPSVSDCWAESGTAQITANKAATERMGSPLERAFDQNHHDRARVSRRQMIGRISTADQGWKSREPCNTPGSPTRVRREGRRPRRRGRRACRRMTLPSGCATGGRGLRGGLGAAPAGSFAAFALAGKQDQLASVDFGGVARLAFLVLPGAVLDLALDVDLVALLAIPFDHIGELLASPFAFQKITRCQAVFSCFWPSAPFHWRPVARDTVATRPPFDVLRTSGSAPRLPIRMTLFRLLLIAYSRVVF